jgi:hypothetical protein
MNLLPSLYHRQGDDTQHHDFENNGRIPTTFSEPAATTTILGKPWFRHISSRISNMHNDNLASDNGGLFLLKKAGTDRTRAFIIS